VDHSRLFSQGRDVFRRVPALSFCQGERCGCFLSCCGKLCCRYAGHIVTEQLEMLTSWSTYKKHVNNLNLYHGQCRVSCRSEDLSSYSATMTERKILRFMKQCDQCPMLTLLPMVCRHFFDLGSSTKLQSIRRSYCKTRRDASPLPSCRSR